MPSPALPALTETVMIDGYSQPGSSQNTLANGDNAVLLIELNGANAGAQFSNGLLFFAADCVVKGLVINRFTGVGIDLEVNAPNVTIQGNFIGVNPTGTAALGNLRRGISIGSSNNTIGGSSPAARNVISGNGSGSDGGGIVINGSGNSVQGNFIGTDPTGTIAFPNVVNGGVFINSGVNNTIGGMAAGARNIISGNSGNGVTITATNNRIRGNYIGTNVNGTAALPNTFAGVLIVKSGSAPFDNVIGGTSVGARNVISGNLGSGVEMIGESGNNQVQGNYVAPTAVVAPNFPMQSMASGWTLIFRRPAGDHRRVVRQLGTLSQVTASAALRSQAPTRPLRRSE